MRGGIWRRGRKLKRENAGVRNKVVVFVVKTKSEIQQCKLRNRVHRQTHCEDGQNKYGQTDRQTDMLTCNRHRRPMQY